MILGGVVALQINCVILLQFAKASPFIVVMVEGNSIYTMGSGSVVDVLKALYPTSLNPSVKITLFKLLASDSPFCLQGENKLKI